MLTNILLSLAALSVTLLIVLVVVVLSKPNQFRIARTARMAAPPEEVFAEVNDFHRWTAWSPYDKRDPNMQRTYEGPPSGVGASYAWNGNSNVGEGRSTILESRPGRLIRIKLEFVRPFAGVNTAEFAFEPAGKGTSVTWSLAGPNTTMMKVMGLVMNMDKMVGKDFEEGLANLKAIVEGAPARYAVAAK